MNRATLLRSFAAASAARSEGVVGGEAMPLQCLIGGLERWEVFRRLTRVGEPSGSGERDRSFVRAMSWKVEEGEGRRRRGLIDGDDDGDDILDDLLLCEWETLLAAALIKVVPISDMQPLYASHLTRLT